MVDIVGALELIIVYVRAPVVLIVTKEHIAEQDGYIVVLTIPKDEIGATYHPRIKS